MDVRIDRVGTGEPLVILNGLLGMNEHWFGVLGPLAERAECILLQPPLLDMKGKGCSIEGVTRLSIAVLETIVDRPAVLLGNSFGGHVALRIAIERPDLVRGLALIGSSGLFERTLEKGVQHSPSKDWIKDKISELFYDPEFHRIPVLVDAAYKKLSERPAAR
ncbi:alpha/beta fold hydrolase, partial [Planctomycetaceae bacterium AH-315-I19]|nr:alpha/beta fold hydrolase [Planctomycetaceae bacterium AH-315-I19]